MTRTTTRLQHGKVGLALHHLRDAAAGTRPLLVLHPLGMRTGDATPAATDGWRGAVHGLDFTGHGGSDHPVGGGYTAEILMGDVDAALAVLGEVTIVGFGLGAYVALLIAGARPALVRGAVLGDGPGLDGGGTRPASPHVSSVEPRRSARPDQPDPWALLELCTDVRPADYATSFARQAAQLSGLAEPIAVACRHRPAWLDAVADEPGVALVPSVGEGLARFT